MSDNGPPVAIGGIGGSGTRVVAQILSDIDFYLGSELNDSLDNLWFTALFKNPAWYKSLPSDSILARNYEIFKTAMTEGLSVECFENSWIRNLVESIRCDFIRNEVHHPSSESILSLLSSNTSAIGDRMWGWKEPNTHIFLDRLIKFESNLKYIHVIRSGLDMAYSSNQAQAKNWGHLYALKSSSGALVSPETSLEFWIEANLRTIDIAEAGLGNRFYVVDYDQLCLHPSSEILKLIHFLGISKSHTEITNLATKINRPNSWGRHKKMTSGTFTPQQLDRVNYIYSRLGKRQQ